MILQSGSDFSPERATAVLRDAGALDAGTVASVAISDTAANTGYVSNIARTTLTYSPDAIGERPDRLFIKMSRSDLHPERRRAGRHEVEFYRAMAGGSAVPIPRIYSGEADAEDRTHIVMQDLGETHFQRPLPVPPSRTHCEATVIALAKLHAHWWNSPRLGADLGTRLTQQAADASHHRLQTSFPVFADFLGDAMLPEQRTAYEKILASSFLDRLTERLIAQRDVSLVHGDMHSGNVMLPKSPADPVMLIDWHLWSIDLAAFDLAFLIALHWPPPLRAALEQPLVRLYHRALIEHGVTGYDWQQCWDDYRTEVIVTMLIPIGQHRRGAPAGIVWFGMQDASAAVLDLACLDLL